MHDDAIPYFQVPAYLTEQKDGRGWKALARHLKWRNNVIAPYK